MALQLEQSDFQRIVGILSGLDELQTETGRWDLVNDVLTGNPRAQDIKGLLNLGGNPRGAAVRLVERLTQFGQPEPGKEALGILVNKLLDTYFAFGDEADFLRGLFSRYPLDVPVAPSKTLTDADWKGKYDPDAVNEKIIGENTLRHVRMLELALAAARSVVLVNTHDPEIGKGSGFMIAPDLVITNHHVIPTAEIAAQSTFTFNYQLDANDLEAPTETVSAVSGGLFYTNPDLDVTVAQIKHAAGVFAPLRLSTSNARMGDRVSIIQHPGGHFKKISMQHNFVQYADSRVLQYTTSTEPGSSGSPVFNDDFDVIAIHHSGGWLTEPNTRLRVFRNAGTSMGAVLQALKQDADAIFTQLTKG